MAPNDPELRLLGLPVLEGLLTTGSRCELLRAGEATRAKGVGRIGRPFLPFESCDEMEDGEVASTVNEVLCQSSFSVTEVDAWSPDKSLSIDRSAGLSRKLAVPKVMLSLGLSIMGSRSTFLGAENLPKVLFSVETRFLVAEDELNGFRGPELGREGGGDVTVPSGSSVGAAACEGEKLDRNADGVEDAKGFELKEVFDGGGGMANYST